MIPPPRLIGIGAAVLVAASVVTVLLTRNDPVDLPDGSPEAAVQAYLRAITDHDGAGALALLDPATTCTAEDLERGWWDEQLTATLEEAETTGDTAVVTVTLAHGSSGLLPDRWREEQRFDLRRTGDDWVIVGDPWPWLGCGKELP